MKSNAAFLAFACAAALSACSDPPPPPRVDTPVESASDARRKDEQDIAGRMAEQKAASEATFQADRAKTERRQFVDTFNAIGKRWGESLNEASRTVRSDMAPMIRKLEAVKADAEAIAVNECTGKARATLVGAMSAAIEAFTLFSKETGDGSAATQQKLVQSSDLLLAAERELDACRAGL